MAANLQVLRRVRSCDGCGARSPVPSVAGEGARRMRVAWIAQRNAKAFLRARHRHLPECRGAILCLGCWESGRLVGVAFLGRPVARLDAQDGSVIEITRVATDGTRNANSKLYSQCKRVAQLLGAVKIKTKTLPEEGGASLRAAGFVRIGLAKGGQWSRPSRARRIAIHSGPKVAWEALCL